MLGYTDPKRDNDFWNTTIFDKSSQSPRFEPSKMLRQWDIRVLNKIKCEDLLYA
jgi:hypothetical protein